MTEERLVETDAGPLLPNFLFLGPDKTGSSWIFRELSRHHQVFLTTAKDTYYFDREWSRPLSWYGRFFSGVSDEKVIGEVCHDYLHNPETPHRILKTLGDDVRLLACLRSPVDRAFSDYLNRCKNGWDLGSFEEAIANDKSYVSTGLYHGSLVRYSSLFPSGNLKVVLFDDLEEDPQEFMDSITAWLGLDPLTLSDRQRGAAREAGVARSPRLAKLAKSAAVAVRARGLGRLVGPIKGSELVQRVLYRRFSPEERPRPNGETAKLIRDATREDVRSTEALTGIPLSDRWGY